MSDDVYLAVADTHALIWYAQGRHQSMGARALRTFQEAEKGRAAIYNPVFGDGGGV